MNSKIASALWPEIGKVYGRLTVLAHEPNQSNRNVWLCRCSCGNEKCVKGSAVVSGNTKSCGCLHKERAESGVIRRRHGQSTQDSASAEYRIWQKMLQRTRNPNNPKYPRYGARGISVCDRWLDFINFFEDMGKRPSQEYSIERIDNDGNYCKENCKWATVSEQANNKSTNRLITLNGITKTITQWSISIGLDIGTIRRRLNRGQSIEDALLPFSQKD